MKLKKRFIQSGISPELKIKMKELESCNERYKIIIEQLDGAIFEYSVADGSILYSTNLSQIFGIEPENVCFPQSVLNRHLIHPDEIESFQQLFEKIRNGAVCAEGEFRLKNAQNAYLCYSIKITTIFDELNVPVRAVARICDITCQKQETQALIQKAQQDELTGLLNKAATQRFIENSLTGDTPCALYVIDVDHFKSINDNLGHMFGDTVLAEVGGILKRLFRSSDIIGRIGGDEFMVLLKNAGDPAMILDKAEALNQCLNQALCDQIGNYTISGSIGVAVYPRDGSTYSELFKKADIALYRAKRSGRNSCVVFGEERETETCSGVFSAFQPDAPPAPINMVPIPKHFHDNILVYVFNLLYQAKDISNAIQIILKMTGEHFHLSRVYMIGNPADDSFSNFNYAWCADGVSAQDDKLYHFICSDSNHFEERFVHGIFFCSDIVILNEPLQSVLRGRGVRSILQIAFLENEICSGCIGFEECKEDRLWTQEEIDVLSAISRMIGVFVRRAPTSLDSEATEKS
jgi:diguanylate cyclase (GGDEF)-like protein/PAS domain S-box-containing protein